MAYKCILLSIICCCIVRTNSMILTDIVNTHTGLVQGIILENVLSKNNYSAFKGIPYAKPPLDRNRFLSPVDPDQWHQVLLTVDHGNICTQLENMEIKGSEDCLYLNVYTPLTAFENCVQMLKPVMVFIHDGAFVSGSGNNRKLGPDFIIDKDVVLVTFNYRLGPAGFLNLQHPEIPGNAGLKDQNFALRWVKKNIAQFGGDPDNVTIFGYSAGAVSVDIHLISDMSRGLFHKSIALSGSVFCPWAFHTPEKAKRNAFNLGKLLNKNTNVSSIDELVQIFQNRSMEELVKPTFSIISLKDYAKYELPYAPSIESSTLGVTVFLKKCFVKKFRSGDFHKGPHILGFTNSEAAIALTKVATKLNNVFNVIKTKLQDLFYIFFPSTRPKRDNSVTLFFKKMSEYLFSAGIDLKQKYMLNYGNNEPIYYYYYTFENNKRYVKGARHTEDLLNIFYYPEKNQSLDYFTADNSNITNKDAMIRNNVVTMLTNFAKYGNPTPSYEQSDYFVNITWEKSDNLGGYLDIGNELLMHSQARPVSKYVENFKARNNDDYNNDDCIPIIEPL